MDTLEENNLILNPKCNSEKGNLKLFIVSSFSLVLSRDSINTQLRSVVLLWHDINANISPEK